jgi:hypothetical protein
VSDPPRLLLAHHLKALKLPTFLREHDKLARQCAAGGVDHTAYLLRLAELELLDRERRMIERRIREARFPAVKSLDSFDFAAIPALNKMLVLELARGAYVEQRENVIALGPSGSAMCRYHPAGRSCCSRSSAGATSGARSWSPATCRSTNGHPCSARSGSPVRSSTGSPITSTSSR